MRGPERAKLGAKKDENPGPGTYYNPKTDSYPKWKFGTEKREKEVKSQTPGYYDLKSGFSTIHTYRK